MPVPSPDSLARLRDFLKGAFTVFELRLLLHDTMGQDFVAGLPGEGTSAEEFHFQAIQALDRNDSWSRFFQAVADRRQHRFNEVALLAAPFGISLADRAGPLIPELQEPEIAPPVAGARFRLVAEIGRGQAAIVYRAWDRDLGVWRAVMRINTGEV